MKAKSMCPKCGGAIPASALDLVDLPPAVRCDCPMPARMQDEPTPNNTLNPLERLQRVNQLLRAELWAVDAKLLAAKALMDLAETMLCNPRVRETLTPQEFDSFALEFLQLKHNTFPNDPAKQPRRTHSVLP